MVSVLLQSVVPVTINYDKIVEENIFAYELLGFLKPKESAAGLFRARQILNKRFGNVYVTLTNPIPVRNYFANHLCSSSLSPSPSVRLSDSDVMAIRRFAHDIICIHNRHNVVTLWPYICVAILQAIDHQKDSCSPTIKMEEVRSTVTALLSLSDLFGLRYHIQRSVDADFGYYFQLHANLFTCETDIASSTCVFRLSEFPIEKDGIMKKEFLSQCVTPIILNNYANQVLPQYCDLSILSLILIAVKNHSLSSVKELFGMVKKLLRFEFIYVPDQEEECFISAFSLVQEKSYILCDGEQIIVSRSHELSTVASLVLPFVAVYQIVQLTAFSFIGATVSQSDLIVGCQKKIVHSLSTGTSALRLCSLSSDTIKNAISSLTEHKALIKQV
ncbi:hypothetical protein AB6A40_003622 [Gnathostoma spinigerum]|uniref:GPAT/DHAPAT C-terminal domain-containing protein n=1 Tax=Gnathostoma spinigerum TaxID=75299 RepID=A0ABD6EA48_9BILA